MNNTEIVKQGLTDIQDKLNKFGDLILKLDEVYNYNAEDELQFLRDIQNAYEVYQLSVSTLAGKIARMPVD